MRMRPRPLGRTGRAHKPFPRAVRCDPWWAIRGAGEPLEPIFAEIVYELEPRGGGESRKRPCAILWGPAMGIRSRRGFRDGSTRS
jgi:hypothetical protein